ncbi:MAG: helix-turn-helix domain-containing protein [Bacilli bacterium]|nr:helix-turn-helix domain-containing protein [Bacilli bacterium]
MKEIGEYLRDERRKNGVSIDEASEDLDVNPSLLEALESGNSKAFKDIFELKDIVKSYSKYLGLDVDSVLDEFNDYIFEKTSKISLDDIKKQKTSEEKTNHIASPYTRIKHTRYDLAPIVLIVAILLFISLIVYVILKVVATDTPVVNKELSSLKGEISYEFTK